MQRHRMTIALTPAEISRSWLVEHYRRQSRAPIRTLVPVGLALVGIVMLVRQPSPIAWVALLWGLFLLLRPITVALRLRFGSGPAKSFDVTVDARGVDIVGALGKRLVPWSEITASGLGSDYLWYEIRHGARATIPFRVMIDRPALEALFEEHGKLRR